MFGKKMPRNKEEEDLDIPGDDDENDGEGAPKKKREKKRKSREERVAERKVIFWTLLVILLVTMGFWLAPKIGSIFRGEPVEIEMKGKDNTNKNVDKPEKKNYVEITL
ncbi:MAG TPA: hypothetical protein VLH94_04805 [Spirochaetia bacterium]|nr:hypothetical protein [Spirochaetia bacterium]